MNKNLSFAIDCENKYDFVVEKAIQEGLKFGFYFIHDKKNNPVMCCCVAKFPDGKYCRSVSLCSSEDQPNKKVGKFFALKRALRAYKQYKKTGVSHYEHFYSPRALKRVLGCGFGDPYKVESPVKDIDILQKEFNVIRTHSKLVYGENNGVIERYL